MSKTLLVLGASFYQLDTINTAKRLGYRVVVTDNVPANPGHSIADASYVVDTTDRAAVLDLARRERISGIIAPCTDVAVPTAAHVAERLNLPGPPEASADILCSKLLFREFLSNHGLPYPQMHRLNHGRPLDPSLFTAGPWVMKPDRSSGSKGIFIISSEAEFSQRLPETLAFSPTRSGILERFIDGHQGTCEGILKNGRLAMTWVMDRMTADPPYVVTRGQNLPTRLSATVCASLFEVLERIFAILRVTDGPFDCDFVVSSEGVFILEMTPRLGGNSIGPLLHKACGFDLVDYGIRQACQDNPRLPTELHTRPSTVVLLGTSQPGKLHYDREEAARLAREPWVDSLAFDVAVGEPVLPFINGRHRVGQAFVHGHDRDELDAHVEELQRRLDVRAD